MDSKLVTVFICTFLFCKYVQTKFVPDIYWREYTGTIPDDAVPGGHDIDHKTTYIGQGFVKERGITPGVIYPGVQDLVVPSFGVKTLNTYVKILCTNQPYAFSWFPVKATEFHLITINKYVVKGGEETGAVVHIGRVAYQGQVITGKIVSGPYETPGNAPIYFVHNNKEIKMESYQALIYNPNATIDVRIS